MTIVSDLKSIDGLFTTTLLVLFLSVIAPGVLIIYLFLPELFLELDGIKFVLLASSLSLPVFILNCVFMPAVMGYGKDDNYDFQHVGVLSGIFSSTILYGCLIAAYIFALKFSLFLGIIVIIEVLWLSFCSVLMYRKGLKL
ncbi:MULTISPECIES: hypothetical protein [Aliivibrio]|uniref:Polysaccharide biosynthesis protein C-terminal domain-containing protein n=2 Tax=Aliivibrio TaxID=511678 RepID=A0A4Q5KLY9_9GAMM|nr:MULTISPECIES: hypothetical protein [Aliivibrio]GGK49605.1 hypothetical protein GCM10007987_35880 [Aliivibrio fischeri]MDD9180702.1 hypothetical protein [Aliivibrio sp. A6]RYU47417.1 hypothetical protein ERW57_18640 [Aliivibrio finisterrensis]RYU48243.1 hypothetical protein ERW56_18805 [Aliivibrio finisterrensis]RYU52834.1 hypothetical protein ERW50_18985 [Aliivibrio finisterrensis]